MKIGGGLDGHLFQLSRRGPEVPDAVHLVDGREHGLAAVLRRGGHVHRSDVLSGAGRRIPTACPGVPTELLVPQRTWTDQAAYQTTAQKLAVPFRGNFKKYHGQASSAVIEAGPRL